MTLRTRLWLLAAAAVVSVVVVARPALAQNEAALRSYFEGKRVVMKIDMPGTSDGVDIRVDAGREMDTSRYSDRLKRYGAAIHAGDTTTVTLVKVKKDLIEFQLGGGGYGTFGDSTSSSVDMPLVEKSNRERDLEQLVRTETDSARKRALQRELDDLRRITAEKTQAEGLKSAQIAAARLKGGSRFNLRYSSVVPASIRPGDLVEILAQYVDFSGQAPPAQGKTPVGSAKKGMLRADAERLFGRPVETSERHEGALRVVTLVFVRGSERITGEFVEDVLIRYTVSSK